MEAMESLFRSLFRKESLDQLSMQDGSGEYISATDRRAWLILAALLIMIASFLLWAFTGRLPVEVEGIGYSEEGSTKGCVFVEPEEFLKRDIDVGKKVYLFFPDARTIEGRITRISDQPMSFEEISRELGYNEWVTEKVMEGNLYRYVLWVKTREPLEDTTIFDAQIIEKTVLPIEYFM